MVTLPPCFVSTDFGTCSYQCFLSICAPISLHMLKCSCALTLSCSFTYYFFFLPILGVLILYDLLFHQIVGKVCICYPSLCSIFLWLSTLCLALGLVLPLFHFLFLLLSLPLIARGMCLLHL